MEKLKPHYPLTDIKAAFSDPAKLNRTYSSRQGADQLRMDDDAVVAVVQALKRSDFEKSMTSHISNQVWQDVYKPSVAGKTLYVKFTVDAMENFLLD